MTLNRRFQWRSPCLRLAAAPVTRQAWRWTPMSQIGILSAAIALQSLPMARAAGGQAEPHPQVIMVSLPSILPQCLDRTTSFGVGPSARARECTRQYCATPDYQTKIQAYAMSRPQTEAEQKDALTCITRWEQDRGNN